MSVAIPRIEAQLHTTVSRAQWVINGYALVFGVLIVTGGRLADLFGRKRMFMAGALIFGFFSLLAGLMPTVIPLIICRALMGVGGAIMWPAVLGLTFGILPASKKALAGGLLAIDSFLMHSAGINRTAGTRMSMTVGYHSVDELSDVPNPKRVLVRGERIYRGNDY